jgi:hypothetical protein
MALTISKITFNKIQKKIMKKNGRKIDAYTAETDFYKILNQEIAAGATKYQNERRYIIALL